MATNFRVIIGKISPLIFIHCLGIPKTDWNIAIQIWKASVAITGYIVQKFGRQNKKYILTVS